MTQAAEELLNDIHNLGLENDIKWSDIRSIIPQFKDDELKTLMGKLASISELADIELRTRHMKVPSLPAHKPRN